MKQEVLFLVLVIIIGCTRAAVTTKEPNEYEQLSFYYNRVTHNLLLKESGRMYINCYIHGLSSQEMKSVHTDHGMKNLQAATMKPTREPSEFEQLSFYYSRTTHNLLLKESGRTYVNCYVDSLSDKEMAMVHTDNGLSKLELKLLAEMKTASQVTMSMLAQEDTNWCNHGLHNRTLTYFSL